MNENGKDLEQFFARLLGTRLRRGQGERSGRLDFRMSEPAAGSASEVWLDGTPKDPEQAILAEFDEERFAEDTEYQSRPENAKLAARLVEIRRAKRVKSPHQSIVKAGDGIPTQKEFEDNREGLNRAEKREQIERQIAALEEQRAALEEGGEE